MRLNIGDLAETLGVARSTVSAWVKDGMPVVETGHTGKAWVFDSAECIEWWADNKRRRPINSSKGDPDGPETYDEAERRKMVANADKAELEMARAAGLVVEIADVATTIAEMHVTVRTRLLSIGNKVRVRVRALLGEDRAAEEQIVATVEEVVADAMAEIRDDPFHEGEASEPLA